MARPYDASKLAIKFAFYREWLRNPKVVGAIAPSSAHMAEKMASVIRPESGLPVLELGPGTGAMTKAILDRGLAPSRLVCVEYCEPFLCGLRQRYPGVNFVHGDAFAISEIVDKLGIGVFGTIVSALPLLTFPIGHRIRLVETMLDLLEPQGRMVQFSYMLKPPVPAMPGSFAVSHLTTVFRNLPPARLWIYQRADARPLANPVLKTTGDLVTTEADAA